MANSSTTPAVGNRNHTVEEVIEEKPLHSITTVLHLFAQQQFHHLHFPDEVDLHCDHAKCVGIRRHTCDGSLDFQRGRFTYAFVGYKCINCNCSLQVFGLKAEKTQGFSGNCTKIYQEPTFGRPIPKRLFQVIGEANRDFFLQARRAIARSLGIGAYAYYRRIVENSKFELVSSVLQVAEATTAPVAQIELLKRAQAETQFSKAIDLLRDVSAIPPVLLIDGHNPLLLLHDLFSEGIHELSDQECLQRAEEAEILLCEMADRMQIALTERKAVRAAITSITSRRKT